LGQKLASDYEIFNKLQRLEDKSYGKKRKGNSGTSMILRIPLKGDGKESGKNL